MTKLVLANLKMYLNNNIDTQNYLNDLKQEKDKFIVFPPIIYLDRFIQNGFITGIQNISFHKEGAHTGEVSALSATDLGAKYVLLGHSEIRQKGESDELINQKIKIALNHNLKVILCVGENLEAYNQNQTKEIINNQISKALKNIDEEIMISYEPVWAIGTSKTPTNNEIEDVVSYIKSLFNYKIKVLYGGSVSEKNIETLNQINNLDGFLIGYAATIPSSLKKIIEVAKM